MDVAVLDAITTRIQWRRLINSPTRVSAGRFSEAVEESQFQFKLISLSELAKWRSTNRKTCQKCQMKHDVMSPFGIPWMREFINILTFKFLSCFAHIQKIFRHSIICERSKLKFRHESVIKFYVYRRMDAGSHRRAA